MSTIVRNEADLDTLLDENLVTEDYALEVLGLKNIADFRKFSRSFMKLSKIVKGIDDSNNEKLDKGLLPSTLSTAEKIVSALQANGGLKFDPDLLYLNDEGTKKVGYYYLDRLKNGIFECLVETTTTVNDSSKFRDISNKASADRLDNLIKVKSMVYGAFGDYRDIQYPDGFTPENCNIIPVDTDPLNFGTCCYTLSTSKKQIKGSRLNGGMAQSNNILLIFIKEL